LLTAGILSFASPWLLTALVALPVIWWLLRLLPPSPKRIAFAPIRLLIDLDQKEQTPAHTPWWLLLLRLLIFALLILGLADPILNATSLLSQRGALVVVLDDGWTAAQAWDRRTGLLVDLLEEAERQDTQVALVRVSEAARTGSDAGTATVLAPAREVKEQVLAMVPQPWLADRSLSVPRLEQLGQELTARNLDADVYWLSDGVDHGGAAAFAKAMSRLGRLHTVVPTGSDGPIAVRPPQIVPEGFGVTVVRPSDAEGGAKGGAREIRIRVAGEKSQLLGHTTLRLDENATMAEGVVDIPFDRRNLARRVEAANAKAAGSVILLDDRWQRRRVGIVTVGQDSSQPLLSDIHYIERALSPHAEIVMGSVSEVLERKVSTLIFADIGQLIGADKTMVETWVDSGGTLVRFAGPRLARQSDALIPVRLREGTRALDGALSWDEPQAIAPFEETSPFAGLKVPDDITIKRQVLAQPGVELNQKTWARLRDGTPLVTGDRFGDGRRVLFHVTATPDWSTLPLSGLFVDMLHRIVSDSMVATAPRADTDGTSANTTGAAIGEQTMLKPVSMLTAFGELSPPQGGIAPLSPGQLETTLPSANSPPGYYGSGSEQFAFNTTDNRYEMKALPALPLDSRQLGYQDDRAFYLQPWLLVAAFLLLLLDGILALILSGRLNWRQLQYGAAIAFAAWIGFAISTPSVQAQTTAPDPKEAFALEATLETPLAYVITGNETIDRMSRAGLVGLARALRQRTAMEPPEDPMGVRIEEDELAFFPLLYWPLVPGMGELDVETRAKVDSYLKYGGTILFDTQDYQSSVPSGVAAQGNRALQSVLEGLDIPPLEPIPEDHVLTKSFYLLQDFPGRWSGGRVWVEARETVAATSDANFNDGVTSIIIGSNDYAAAWAEDSQGRPLAAVVPGGDRQRELAKRFGINVVIYVLTGNYKADQVHVPALLERLGQ